MEQLQSITNQTPIEIMLGIDNENKTTAKKLYEFLELDPSNYAKWVKRNILENKFAEDGVDFHSYQMTSEGRGKFAEDFKLTAKFAKKLSMTAKNERGEQARDYFVKCEDKLKEITQPSLPTTYKEALKQLLIEVEEKERLALENSNMKPKAEYFDALVDRNLLTNFRDTAKEIGIKEKDFISFLISGKFIYRDQSNTLKPYADRNNGLFELKEFASRYSDHVGTQTMITPKGRETFRLMLKGALA